tara:strand:- start:13681 stop:14145 length:465 start_codon:yes stop_codon:yes gene_type:complete
MRFIAIDPGWSGAMAVYKNNELIRTHKCMPTSTETWELVREDIMKSNIAILEWVHSFPGQGVVSTFKFGYNYGMWNGFLAAASKETMLVSPQMWQKNWDNVPKVKKDRKNFLKAEAQKVANGVKVTLVNADAICIGQWYLNQTGDAKWTPKVRS